jgi:hypothetical protein
MSQFAGSGADELPWDELDPCCQQEILDKRRKAEVNSKLRVVDRSNDRMDARKRVFKLTAASCVCCLSPCDYPLLQELRAENNSIFCSDINIDISKVAEPEQDEDGEDDEFVDLLDDLVTPYEQERAQELQQRMEAHQLALSAGFGVHKMDSIDHVVQQISSTSDVVLHLCDPASYLGARIDLELEKLAAVYCGTLFRWIRCSATVVDTLRTLSNSRHGNKIPIVSGRSAFLLCFKYGVMTAVFDDLQIFGDEHTIYPQALSNALENAGSLVRSPSEEYLQRLLATKTTSSTEDMVSNAHLCSIYKLSSVDRMKLTKKGIVKIRYAIDCILTSMSPRRPVSPMFEVV